MPQLRDRLWVTQSLAKAACAGGAGAARGGAGGRAMEAGRGEYRGRVGGEQLGEATVG